jgi:hypothetical protein
VAPTAPPHAAATNATAISSASNLPTIPTAEPVLLPAAGAEWLPVYCRQPSSATAVHYVETGAACGGGSVGKFTSGPFALRKPLGWAGVVLGLLGVAVGVLF